MIADVVFDAPLDHPLSYRVPEGWTVAPGQRVLAPLRGAAARPGLVVAVRRGDPAGLKALLRPLDPAARLGPAQLELARWIAEQGLTSLGSTGLALLPPPDPGPDSPAAGDPGAAGPPSPRPAGPGRAAGGVELLVGPGREARLLDALAGPGPALLLAADLETAGRWAQRLGRHDRVVRLDSGVAEAERARAWTALAAGTARLAVGTRSALLAPLPAGARIALVDEHEAAHKPPGPPRLHARDVVLERAAREGLAVLMTSATPSVEMWWRAAGGQARLDRSPAGPWPAVTVADTRGIARREALTPVLSRAIRETLAAGRRVYLAVSRLTSALGCDECGAIMRCPRCAVALAYSPAGRRLACRVCGEQAPLPETCPDCRGRRLLPFGWGAERVEHAVRRRFSGARIARYDPEAGRGRRAESQRAAVLAADVVIGARAALRQFGPGTLGLAGFISPDQLLGLPDFRAAERALALMWAAAERVRADGQLVIQSQNPSHYAVEAVARQDLALFYDPEVRFRRELGYPPFRRLALVTVRGPDPAGLAAEVAAALAGPAGLTVYGPAADRGRRSRRIVVKGEAGLPAALAAGLAAVAGRRGRRGIMDVEVDPVEWPS